MISLAKTVENDVLAFLEARGVNCQNLSENFGKTVWLIESRDAGELVGILSYSFMYSTWTRYNPFISLCLGDNQREMVNFLRKNFPDRLIRGCVENSGDKSM